MALGFGAPSFVFVGAVLLFGPMGCGLIDGPGTGGSVPLENRWLFLQAEDTLTLARFDDPHRPHLEALEPMAGSFWWSPGAERALVLGEAEDPPLLVEAPSWQPYPLPSPEVFDRAYFVGPGHFLAARSVGIDAGEWVLRDLPGTELGRWGMNGTVHSISPSGAFVAFEDEELTLVRRDLTSVVLRAPGLSARRMWGFFDEVGEHALIATWTEDAVDFGPLPDFVAHVEMEAPPDCADERDCLPIIETYPKRLADTDMIAATGVWPTSAGNAARLFVVPLGQKNALSPPELTDPHFQAYWDESTGDAWVDAPTGRVRLVQADADAQTWTVDERNALDPASDWERIAEGTGTFTRSFHVDFDLLWLHLEDGVHALDLANGRPPRALGKNSPDWVQGRRALFLGDESTGVCGYACPYVAYVDPSDPDAPVLRGTLDALHLEVFPHDADFHWAPDQSGLLLRSDGWLYYHAFAEPSVRFRLAPMGDETRIQVPPVW